MMKLYCAIWYNDKTGDLIPVRILSDGMTEAKETMILYMNNTNGNAFGNKYTQDDIESIIEEDPDFFITREYEYEIYKKRYKIDPEEEHLLPKKWQILNWEGKEDEPD